MHRFSAMGAALAWAAVAVLSLMGAPFCFLE